jgi:sulfur relay (sulfurtransferase) DsrC/TusE family protein
MGEVTEEDEGAETTKKKDKPRQVTLCKELSDLISLARCHFISFLTSKEIRMLIYGTKKYLCGLIS